MYIEQGYKGDIGIWKFWVLPVGFIALMALNYVSMQYSPVSVDVMMADLIAKWGSNRVLILLLAPLVVGLFVVWTWVKLVHHQSITSLTTSRKKVDWRRILFAFAVWGLITIAVTGVDILLSPEDYVFNFQPLPFLNLVIIGLLLIPFQTSFEEYLFRGHMMQGVGLMAGNRWMPLLLTSLLFGLMHLGNPEVEKLGSGILIFYIGTGLFLGIITLMDEGLELALGFHAANNLITALLVTADWTAFQTHSLFKDISAPALDWDVLIPVFVIYPALLYFFGKKYGWTNWKERLSGKVLPRSSFLALSQSDGAKS
jgi:hypothetical protein